MALRELRALHAAIFLGLLGCLLLLPAATAFSYTSFACLLAFFSEPFLPCTFCSI